ncbi:unnamed protein product [Clonostachys byssicola]|uniref:Uncharacterized protein n=1 Tax=Clonostachys byssicola TaxID=160290 RepID=A0A9N9Y2M8_9HYPO|nr:unnamed protein product [Clonostachys byssicola]
MAQGSGNLQKVETLQASCVEPGTSTSKMVYVPPTEAQYNEILARLDEMTARVEKIETRLETRIQQQEVRIRRLERGIQWAIQRIKWLSQSVTALGEIVRTNSGTLLSFLNHSNDSR